MAKPKSARRAARKRRRELARLKNAAGNLAHDPTAPTPVIHMCSYGPDGFSQGDPREAGAIKRARARWPVTWVHVVGLGDAVTIESLGRTFGIHRLALEDVINTQHRPKVDQWGEVTQVVVRMVDDVGSAQTEQLSIFIGHDFVLSFEERKGELFEALRQRLREDVGEARKGRSDFLAYA